VELERNAPATPVRGLGLVLPGLHSHMGWILPRIGIKMESIDVQGFRGTVKKRYGFLPQRCRAPVGCPSWKIISKNNTLRSVHLTHLTPEH